MDIAGFDFMFTAKDNKYNITREQMTKSDNSGGTNVCHVLLTMGLRNDLDLVVMGTPLFKEYYVIMNFKKSKIALSGWRKKVEKGSKTPPAWLVIIVIAILLGIVAVGFSYVIKQRRKRLSQHLNQYN